MCQMQTKNVNESLKSVLNAENSKSMLKIQKECFLIVNKDQFDSILKVFFRYIFGGAKNQSYYHNTSSIILHCRRQRTFYWLLICHLMKS
jgi:hypothetical protein